MIPRALIVLTLSLSVLPYSAHAERIGVYGNTWEIAEPDMVDWIKAKLRAMEKSGKLKQYEEDSKRKALDKIESPPPVPGITWAAQSRTWTLDPTYTVKQTEKDNNGNIIAPAGKKVNPLDFTSLTKSVVFIDARDPKQVAFAKKDLDAHPRDKIVLVGGSWLKLTREWKRQVYYDQDGTMTRHFHITRVPAVLSQKGRVLQIEEVAQ